MPVPYTISETSGGAYVVQCPNGTGGLFPLVRPDEDIRSTKECFARIAKHALDSGNLYDGVEVTFLWKGHPANSFTNG